MLRECGIDASALIAEIGLRAETFDHPDNVIPFAKLGELAHLAAERTGLPDLGLRNCITTGLAVLGTVGHLVANSATVGGGLTSIVSYLHLRDEGAAPFIKQEGRLAIMGYEVLEPDLPGTEQIVFGALVVITNLLREICGANTQLHQFFALHVRDNKVVGEGGAVKDQSQRIMRTLLSTGCIDQDEVARAFGMSRRTFARRLEENGTTFRELLDAARFDAARGLLRSSGASLEDIANRLCYSDATAFARAFRRWSGESPAAWRRNHGVLA